MSIGASEPGRACFGVDSSMVYLTRGTPMAALIWSASSSRPGTSEMSETYGPKRDLGWRASTEGMVGKKREWEKSSRSLDVRWKDVRRERRTRHDQQPSVSLVRCRRARLREHFERRHSTRRPTNTTNPLSRNREPIAILPYVAGESRRLTGQK